MIEMLRRLSIQRRLLILFGLAVLLLLGLEYSSSSELYRTLLHDRQAQTRNVVEEASGVLKHFYQLQTAGTLTEAQAQAAAKSVLGDLRYSNDGYFWINDLDTRMIMHPIKPSLDGKILAAVKDPAGKHLFQAIVDVAKAKGEGRVDYLWPKPGHDEPVEKTSYVKLFKPWGWVVGSGVYLDDISSDFRDAMITRSGLIAAGLLILIIASFMIGRSIIQPLESSANALENIASGDGDLTQRLPTAGEDELARLGEAFNTFATKIGQMIGELDGVISRNRETSGDVIRVVKGAERASAEQKQELDTVAAAVEQMVTTNEDVARRLGESAEAAKEADAAAVRGGQLVQTTNQAMETLAGNIAESASTMTELAQESQNIGGVLDVIRGVADQTNLLALNAAIEAARAGEQGRGFAVVADEVRSLAQRTQDSTDEIQQMISRLQQGADKAVAAMTASQQQSESARTQVLEASEALETIVSLVGTITELTQHVAAAAEEQTQTSGEISRSLNGVASYGDDLVSRLKETVDATHTLSSSAETLENIVSQFRTNGRPAKT